MLCLWLLKLLAILLLAVLREALSVSSILAVLCIAAATILREPTVLLAIAVLTELLTGHERGRARLEASGTRSESAEAGRGLLLWWWLLHVHLLRLLSELVGLGLPVVRAAVGVGHGGEAVSVREWAERGGSHSASHKFKAPTAVDL